MTISGRNYWLTKHGRKRYLERHGYYTEDAKIITDCVTGPTSLYAVWKPDRKYPEHGRRLVTVLPAN